MGRTQKQIKQQTEEWLDERWIIANMKDSYILLYGRFEGIRIRGI